ncbi:hypothetical protein CYMTET_27461 [Cymbomonas tetramitiformis]|uniref:Uncharacterized protein n=1 Tax=Cymbomonas tetramitiformis TaxID=36881 RepID=A0AAE0FPQ0_9CHLO|nr:hypothetical protein CYMTET_27461 [Cymbomonas tetramitiformis]
METRNKTTQRKLLKESDLDSSVRLSDAVRDSPTCRTPPVPILPPRAEHETDAVRIAREGYASAKDIVATIYSKGRHRKWAKAVHQHQLGGDYFGDATDVSKLAKVVIAIKSEISTAGLSCDVFDLDNPTLGVQRAINELLYDTLTYVVEPASVAYGYLLGTDSATDRDGRRALIELIIKGCVPPAIRQKHQAEHSALRYPAQVDPRSVLAMEQRLARENRAEEWTPTAATPAYAGGTPGTAAAVGVLGDEKPDRDDILGKLLARLDKIEAFIKTQRLGGAAAAPPKRHHKGLDGFRVGTHTEPRVGFDPGAKRAIPKCPSKPVEECTPEDVHTLALCQVFQAAAEDGASAFAAAVELHGAPAVVRAGAAAGSVDISAYGFSTGASGASGDDDIDVHEELRDLRQQIGTAISMGQVSVPPGQGLSFAGVSAEPQGPIVPSAGSGQPVFVGHLHTPTEEFPGGIELVPVRHHG